MKEANNLGFPTDSLESLRSLAWVSQTQDPKDSMETMGNPVSLLDACELDLAKRRGDFTRKLCKAGFPHGFHGNSVISAS